jgi:hypothetical protein
MYLVLFTVTYKLYFLKWCKYILKYIILLYQLPLGLDYSIITSLRNVTS